MDVRAKRDLTDDVYSCMLRAGLSQEAIRRAWSVNQCRTRHNQRCSRGDVLLFEQKRSGPRQGSNEIRSAFAQEYEVQPGPALRNCAFFQACISETLRLSTPIGSSPVREVGEGGEVVDGHFIPQGTMIETGLYSLHHNESYFPEPDAFLPERWLAVDNDTADGSSVSAAAHDKTTGCGLHVFLAGARACIGQGLALSEIQFIMARCIWRYDFRSAPGPNRQVGAGSRPGSGDPDKFQLQDRITPLKDGPVIEFRQKRQQHVVG